MFGMPRRLFFGYLALAVFMNGDGLELTFLFRFLVENGFMPTQAGLVFTVYGLMVAVSAWTTGVLAEVVGAKRLMVLGGVLWMVLHVLFLTVGLESVLGTILIYALCGVTILLENRQAARVARPGGGRPDGGLSDHPRRGRVRSDPR
ncbi:hypothetical protein ACH9D2_13045 [Kocuria sp. M4R2S49]|uniref:hypothetical protein n=1 Tax=Kocuria rhizosphaericola TaxID=3376284 RepID=UPI0037B52577